MQTTERYTDTLKQGKDKKPNSNSYGRKSRERKRLYTNACGKERKNSPQMPRAKKKEDQTTNDGGKRKMAALIRKANEKRLP